MKQMKLFGNEGTRELIKIIKEELNKNKFDVTGTEGQLVSFDNTGKPIAIDGPTPIEDSKLDEIIDRSVSETAEIL